MDLIKEGQVILGKSIKGGNLSEDAFCEQKYLKHTSWLNGERSIFEVTLAKVSVEQRQAENNVVETILCIW